MHTELPTPKDQSTGTFTHVATSSFYGTEISPPLRLEISFEVFKGRPVFRKATDPRGLIHEIELLDLRELKNSYEKALAGWINQQPRK